MIHDVKGGAMAESLGVRIRMHRVRLGWKQVDLAEKVGISTQAISLIEMGKTEPRANHIRKIADALGVSADYLLGRKDTWNERLPTGQDLVPA
jgi:transcriptional regulator with XRE-family HTH domain